MSPRRVLAEHSSRDLSDWMAYERVYGLAAGHAADERAGTLAAAVWNSRGGLPVEGSKQGRVAHPSDFMPRLSKPTDDPEPVSHDEVPADEPEPVESEAERQTRALKNAFGAWGVQYNAALRRLRENDPEAG